jgi:TctA family transporter
MLEAAISAFGMMLDPGRLLILGIAVIIGLAIGVIPGLGGIVGLAILIPFTYGMDPLAAFAFLIGMAAVTSTSDTIPAVLFGVPGTSAAAATVVDGYPMARNGEAGRAFGAAYSASLIGGVFGAFLLALTIPVLRPIMLYFGSPELLMLTVFGLTMVAALSGSAPLRGIAAAGIGLALAMIGLGSQGGTLRWTMGEIYLWDGLPLVPLTLGLFALPELMDMAITRSKIARDDSSGGKSSRAGQWQGVRDTFKNLGLTLRCSGLGAAIGAVPGLGSAVVDWLAYGHTVRTTKDKERFGKGDVRGVIGPESANNAKTGGSLVPTIAFGVPGSASMALILGAFMMHGLIPGPEMLKSHLDITYGIIWSLALANILGAGICLLFADQFAKIALVRFGILVPVVTVIVFLGAYQGTSHWGDVVVLLLVALVGWVMKHLGWPRPPLLLGFVLGEIFERYLWISLKTSMATSETGSMITWLSRPLVIVLIAMTVWGLWSAIKPWAVKAFTKKDRTQRMRIGMPRITPNVVFSAVILAVLAVAYAESTSFSFNDRVVPQVALTVALICTALSLLWSLLVHPAAGAAAAGETDAAPTDAKAEDLGEHWGRRFAGICAWLLVFPGLIWLIGFLPAIVVFSFAYMVIDGRERASIAAAVAVGTAVISYAIFHMAVKVSWPTSWLGDAWPALRDITGFL